MNIREAAFGLMIMTGALFSDPAGALQSTSLSMGVPADVDDGPTIVTLTAVDGKAHVAEITFVNTVVLPGTIGAETHFKMGLPVLGTFEIFIDTTYNDCAVPKGCADTIEVWDLPKGLFASPVSLKVEEGATGVLFIFDHPTPNS